MVEKYLTTINPLTEKIRAMNYGYYAIETNVENSEGIEGDAIEGVAKELSTDEDISREKKAIYTLVARPYRLEQFEQERK